MWTSPSINSGCRSGSRRLATIAPKDNHVNIVTGQLEGCINYNKQNPSKLIGCCMFSYLDKVWAKGSEGSFGTWTHARPGATKVSYTDKDFTHRDMVPNSQPPKAHRTWQFEY